MPNVTHTLFSKDGKYRYAKTPSQEVKLEADGWVRAEQPAAPRPPAVPKAVALPQPPAN